MISVTGANGFLGQAVLKYCLAHGIEVKGYSRSIPIQPNIVQVQNYQQIPATGALIHLAENRNVNQANAETNTAQWSLCQSLASAGFSQIVYASSIAVYKPSASNSDPESLDLNSTEYALGKLRCEQLFQQHGYLIARIANVYGPGMAEQNVISAVLAQAYAQEMKLYNLTAIRDFIWVDDVVAALVQMAHSKLTGVFNVSSGIAYSVADLVALTADITGNQPERIIELFPAAPSRLVVDNSQTVNQFNWRPVVTMAQGLRMLVQGTV